VLSYLHPKTFGRGAAPSSSKDCRSAHGQLVARGARVAVVDDEEAMTMVTAALLERLGYSTVSYTCASRFMKEFDAAPERIDLIVADVVMPGISGVQLVQSLRESGHDIPVLLMTGYSGVKNRLQPGGSAGRISFVRKPFNSAHLAQSVRRLLSDRE
jgi:FixJ family two-component response regulator